MAIDDFGSEDSNFDRLWLLEPDIVKLDRSLIVQSASDRKQRAVSPSVGGLGVFSPVGALAV